MLSKTYISILSVIVQKVVERWQNYQLKSSPTLTFVSYFGAMNLSLRFATKSQTVTCRSYTILGTKCNAYS